MSMWWEDLDPEEDAGAVNSYDFTTVISCLRSACVVAAGMILGFAEPFRELIYRAYMWFKSTHSLEGMYLRWPITERVTVAGSRS
jgi:hypothetical protein